MPMNLDLFWFPEFATHIHTLAPQPEVDNYAELNEALTGLPFGASDRQINTVLAGKGRVGSTLPANTRNGFADFETWRKTELAQMRLRRLIRAHVGVFDNRENRAVFTARIDDQAELNEISRFLINTQLPLVAGDGPRRKACLFAAIVHAFSNDALYAFTPEHKANFLQALIERTPDLIAAGIPAEELSAAIIGLLAFVRDQLQFQAIVNNLYFADPLGHEVRPLAAHVAELNQYFEGQVAAADVERLTLLQTYAQHLPLEGREAFNGAVAARAIVLLHAVNDAAGLQVLAALFAACGKQANLNQELQQPANIELLLDRGITLEGVVAAHGPGAAVTEADVFNSVIGNDGADLDGADLAKLQQIQRYLTEPVVGPVAATQADRARPMMIARAQALINGVENLAGLQAIAAFLRVIIPGGEAALRAHLALPATMEALFQKAPPMTIEEIFDVHGATADVANVDMLFQVFNNEVDGADLERIAALQAFVAAGGPAHSQQAHFDDAVVVPANVGRLLLAAAADEAAFTRTLTVLRDCTGGVDVVNAHLAIAANIIALINAGVSVTSLRGTGRLDAICNMLAEAPNPTTLFNAMTRANYQTVGALLYAAPINAAFKDAFCANFTLANIERLLGAPNNFTINEIGGLVTGQANYAHADAVTFRKTHIDAILAELQTYLDSVIPPQGNAPWKHNTPAVDTNPAAIEAQLTEFKTRIEIFNDQGARAVYQQAPHENATHQGTRALQTFMSGHPLIVQKLSHVYSNFDRVRREFAMCRLDKDVQEQHLINGVKQQINDALALPTAAEKLAGLQAIPVYITRLQAAWHASSDRLRQNVAHAAKEYLLSPEGALLSVLNRNAIENPQQVVDLCNQLTPTQTVSVFSLQVRLKDAIGQLVQQAGAAGADLVALRQRLGAILEVCNRFPEVLNKAQIVNEIKDHFLQLVGAGLITDADNYVRVSGFLEDPAAPMMGDTLEADILRRRDAFFNDPKLMDGKINRDLVFKELRLLRDANNAVLPGQFFNVVYGAIDQAADTGRITLLLANGVKLSEFADRVGGESGVTMPEPAQLQEKVLTDITATIGNIVAQDLAGVNDARKAENKKDFSRVVRIYQNADTLDEAARNTVKNQVFNAALGLLKRGVSVTDLRAIHPAINVTELQQEVARDPAMTAEQKAALRRDIFADNVSTASPQAFFDSLAADRQTIILENFRNNKVPRVQREEILKRAFDAIKAMFAADLDAEGKIIRHSDELWRAYQNAFNQASLGLRTDANTTQARQGLRPEQLNTLQHTREALSRFSGQINKIADRSERANVETIIELLIKLDKLRQIATATPSESAFAALETAKNALAQYSEEELDALAPIYAEDRATLEGLKAQVNEKLIAVEMLIGSDMSTVFKDALLGEIAQWPMDRALSRQILDALQDYLRDDPSCLITEAKAGFQNIIRTLGLTDAEGQNFIVNARRSIASATQEVVTHIQTRLRQQGVMGDNWFVSTELQHQAQQLWDQYLKLDGLKLSINEKLDKPTDVVALKQGVLKLKTDIQAALDAKGDKTAVVGKKPVVFETSVPLAARHMPTPEQIQNLFRETAATGVHRVQVGTRNTAKPEELADHTYVVKLDGQHFTTVNVLKAAESTKPVGVTIDTTKVTRVVDAAIGNTQNINVEHLVPNTPEFAKFAVEMGVLLAQSMMDASDKDNFAMFKPSAGKRLDISGSFTKPGHAGQFELAVMDVAVKTLTQRGYTINPNSGASVRFDAAIKAQGRFVNQPQFQQAMMEVAAKTSGRDNLDESAKALTTELRGRFRH